MSQRRVAQFLGGLGALILMATAGLHMLGLDLAKTGAAEVSNSFLAALLAPL